MINEFKGRWFFLSNFYPCEITHQGITYKTVEAYYVAMKVNDEQLINGKYYTPGDFREMIALIPEPGITKKIGQKVKLRKDWDTYKLEVMNWGVREKFKYPKLAEKLIDTGDEELIEGNWWHDNFYGSCTCTKCANKGRNELGKILMNVRDDFK